MAEPANELTFPNKKPSHKIVAAASTAPIAPPWQSRAGNSSGLALPTIYPCQPCLSLVFFLLFFFFYSSQTFSKGLLPQPQPLQQLREEHFIFLHRLRLLPRRRGRAHGCHRHPQPLHPLLGNAREPQHQAAGGPRQGELQFSEGKKTFFF